MPVGGTENGGSAGRPRSEEAHQAILDATLELLAEVGFSALTVEGVAQPCTMLWGDADRSHRKTDPSSLLACCPSARIVRSRGVGHFPDLEQPERFAALLLEHLAALA